MTWHRFATWVLGATLPIFLLPACDSRGGGSNAPAPSGDGTLGGGIGSTGGKEVTYLGSRRPGDTVFEFRNSEEEPVSLRVLLDGEELEGALISIVDTLPEPEAGQLPEDLVQGGVYFQGQTDHHGRVVGTVKVPTERTTLDVIVDHVDAEGPYTSSFYRDLWGPMRPSSRTNHPRDRLQGLTIRLTRVP